MRAIDPLAAIYRSSGSRRTIGSLWCHYDTCMRNGPVPPEICIPPDVASLEPTFHTSSLQHIQLVLPKGMNNDILDVGY